MPLVVIVFGWLLNRSAGMFDLLVAQRDLLQSETQERAGQHQALDALFELSEVEITFIQVGL